MFWWAFCWLKVIISSCCAAILLACSQCCTTTITTTTFFLHDFVWFRVSLCNLCVKVWWWVDFTARTWGAEPHGEIRRPPAAWTSYSTLCTVCRNSRRTQHLHIFRPKRLVLPFTRGFVMICKTFLVNCQVEEFVTNLRAVVMTADVSSAWVVSLLVQHNWKFSLPNRVWESCV